MFFWKYIKTKNMSEIEEKLKTLKSNDEKTKYLNEIIKSGKGNVGEANFMFVKYKLYSYQFPSKIQLSINLGYMPAIKYAIRDGIHFVPNKFVTDYIVKEVRVNNNNQILNYAIGYLGCAHPNYWDCLKIYLTNIKNTTISPNHILQYLSSASVTSQIPDNCLDVIKEAFTNKWSRNYWFLDVLNTKITLRDEKRWFQKLKDLTEEELFNNLNMVHLNFSYSANMSITLIDKIYTKILLKNDFEYIEQWLFSYDTSKFKNLFDDSADTSLVDKNNTIRYEAHMGSNIIGAKFLSIIYDKMDFKVGGVNAGNGKTGVEYKKQHSNVEIFEQYLKLFGITKVQNEKIPDDFKIAVMKNRIANGVLIDTLHTKYGWKSQYEWYDCTCNFENNQSSKTCLFINLLKDDKVPSTPTEHLTKIFSHIEFEILSPDQISWVDLLLYLKKYDKWTYQEWEKILVKYSYMDVNTLYNGKFNLTNNMIKTYIQSKKRYDKLKNKKNKPEPTPFLPVTKKFALLAIKYNDHIKYEYLKECNIKIDDDIIKACTEQKSSIPKKYIDNAELSESYKSAKMKTQKDRYYETQLVRGEIKRFLTKKKKYKSTLNDLMKKHSSIPNDQWIETMISSPFGMTSYNIEILSFLIKEKNFKPDKKVLKKAIEAFDSNLSTLFEYVSEQNNGTDKTDIELPESEDVII
jgi:hypothetical protein